MSHGIRKRNKALQIKFHSQDLLHLQKCCFPKPPYFILKLSKQGPNLSEHGHVRDALEIYWFGNGNTRKYGATSLSQPKSCTYFSALTNIHLKIILETRINCAHGLHEPRPVQPTQQNGNEQGRTPNRSQHVSGVYCT